MTETPPAPAERLAVYIAGDHNIFFPGLVTLTTIRQHNPTAPIDYFMLFEGDGLTDRMEDLLTRHDIGFIPVESLNKYGTIDDMAQMEEKAWPTEVFFNWLAPLAFWDLGYRDIVKADYDMLCVAPWVISDLRMVGADMGTTNWHQSAFGDGVLPETAAELGWTPRDEKGTIDYSNVGFVAIDGRSYVQSDFFGIFKNAYQALMSQAGKVAAAEQVAFGIAIELAGLKIKKVDRSYNHRITTIPDLDKEFRPNLRNIHFLTSNKPWRPLSFKYMDAYAKDVRAGLFLYRNLWLKQAAHVEGFSEFVDERPLDTLNELGVAINVVKSMHKYR